MKRLTWLLYLVGVIQITLGLAYLFMPEYILHSMGHSVPQTDIYYPLAMLAARFIAYGAALLYIASAPAQHSLWLKIMVLIQIIDLAAGIFYTLSGVVPLSLSGFPMFNATWIIALLLLWMPKAESKHQVVSNNYV